MTMFRSFGEKLMSFRLQRTFKHAMEMAGSVDDMDERIRWCERGLEIAGTLDPWPFLSPSRDFAVGSLHGMRGQAYLELRARDYRELVRLSVADLEIATKLLTPETGEPWGHLMNILSIAYCESVEGNPADNKERAIQAAEAALSALDPLRQRGLWVETMNNLAGYYAERMYSSRRENQEKSLLILERAQAATSPEYDPREWAMVTASLANAYHRRNGNGGADVEKAIDLIESALPILRREVPPEHCAGAMMSLSSYYRSRIKGDSVRNTERALQALDLVLDVLSPTQTPTAWAMAQMNLGGVWAEREDGDPTRNMESAISAFENALKVYTSEDFPVEHAEILMNLSQARGCLESDSKRMHTERAVEHARAALATVSEEMAPRVWALACIRLGNALRERRDGDRRQDLEEAIASFEAALTVLTPEADPELWSMAQGALADALAERIAGAPVDNLERAIVLQQEALAVIDPLTSCTSWAGAMMNLAMSFGERVAGSRADNLERALALAELGLVVLNGRDHATQRSRLLEAVGEAFEYRIRGDKLDNLHRAVEAYDQAAEARSRSENPESWLRLRQRRLTALKLLHQAFTDTPHPPEHNTPLSRRMSAITVADPQEFLDELQDAASSVSAEDHPRTWTIAQEDLAQAQLLRTMSHNAGTEAFTKEMVTNLQKSLSIYEGMLAVNPKETRPHQWARTRRQMAADYTLLHMFIDLQHRGPGGLADRAKFDLPNRSEEAMRYLALAAEAHGDVLSVHTAEYAPREHLANALKLGSCHIWRRDWAGAASAFASAGVAAERLLADVETCESEVRDTLRALGDLSTAGPFVEVINGRLLQSLDLFEVGRARLLAKALKLASLPLSDDERARVNELLQQISEQERLLTGPNLIDRTTPLDEAVRLRRQFREVLAGLDPAAISPAVDMKRLLTEVTSKGSVVVVPLLTDAGGRILLGYNSGSDVSLEVADTDDVITLEPGIFRTHVREGLPGWLDAYKEFVTSAEPDLDKWNQILEATAESLGELIATPLLSQLDSSELDLTRLDIFPQGPLGLLPLNLARDTATGTALIDRFDVSLSPSLTVLANVHSRRRQAMLPRSIALIKQPDALDLDPLPYTEVEADLAASWFDEPAISDARYVSKEAALASLRGQDIWHFACHGQFDLSAPLNSRLGPLKDGWLTLEDLFDARGIGNPQLVILSACSTGLYDTRELPSEFIGLPNAFLQLGATAVVAALWPVLDITTTLLVGRFYEEYLGAGKPSCSALRAAQLWLRTARMDDLRRAVEAWVGDGRIKAEPAAFVMVGLDEWATSQTPPFEQPAYWSGFVHFGA